MSQFSQHSDEEIARAWIRRYSKARTRILLVDTADPQLRDEKRIEEETWWAFEEIEGLVANEPSRAWTVILYILELGQKDENVLDNLAAGPLETLLVRHGRDSIDRVENEAQSDPRFKDLLLGVWGNAVDATVWERLEALFAAE